MGFTDKDGSEDVSWGTGTESRNPFETKDSGEKRNSGGTADASRANMRQGNWESGRPGDGSGSSSPGGSAGNSWQRADMGSGWQGNSMGGSRQGNIPGSPVPPPKRSGGRTAGKVLLAVGMILRGLMVLGSIVMVVSGFMLAYRPYSEGYNYDYDYDSGDDDSYSWSFEYDFGSGSSDPFAESGYQTESEKKDSLDDAELEDTSDVLSSEEEAEITSSAKLGLATSLRNPATEGQWIRTKKTIDGTAYDVFFRVTDIRPMDMDEIEAFNASQGVMKLVPTSNPDFVDLMCTYEIYYPEGTPADRHQKDFYADIVSRNGYFEMKSGTVYQDAELDDVYDVTIDPDNSVTREKEIFTGQMTYAVTKDCTEYYFLIEDVEAAGRAYIRCSYEQGA